MFVRGWADDVGSLKDGMLVRGGGEKQGETDNKNG
jgi:hypothetical protein